MKRGPTLKTLQKQADVAGMFARIEKIEGIDQPLELALYPTKAAADGGDPMLLIELSNVQISELIVVYKIKPVMVDADRRAIA